MTSKRIPYRKGEPCPGDEYVLVHGMEENGRDLGLNWIPQNDLRLAMKRTPIRHHDLGPLAPVALWVWQHLRQHISWLRSFEDWELGFKRDTHPESEIAYWVKATYAYLEFTHRHPHFDKDKVFAALINLINGRDDLVGPKSFRKQLKDLVSKPPDLILDTDNYTEDGHLKIPEEHLQ
jgi:hypothetical protein